MLLDGIVGYRMDVYAFMLFFKQSKSFCLTMSLILQAPRLTTDGYIYGVWIKAIAPCGHALWRLAFDSEPF